MASELGRIVAYVEKLGELANAPGFGDLQTTTRAIERMPLREDEPGDSLEHELAMSEAPHSLDGGFAVPTFVDEG
jgi:aspartyl/glutamyl-tRNA(Asn/Gln) amidotransferase C subunit